MKTKILLALVFCLAFLMRFYLLGKIPDGINLDEAAIGWNAWSILKTGKDEYGKFLPLSFRSHDDYKPPLYIYLTVPSVAAFGLTEFAVRFPAALMGTIAAITSYLLTFELAHFHLFFTRKKASVIGLCVAFLLAINPWHLQFSRAAFETGATVLFTSLGLFFLLKALRKNTFLDMLMCSLSFAGEIYLYQASKVIIPVFLFFALLIFRNHLKKLVWKLLIVTICFFLLAWPMFIFSISDEGSLRFKGTNIFQDQTLLNHNTLRQIADWLRRDRLFAEIFHWPGFAYSGKIVENYLSHFDLSFLFAGNHGHPINHIPTVSLIPIFELPLIFLGIISLFNHSLKQYFLLFISWILIVPIPSSLTVGVPSAIRAASFLPVWQIFSGLGLLYVFLHMSYHKKIRIILKLFSCFLVSIYVAYMLHMAYVHIPLENYKAWFYGYKQLILDTKELAKDVDKVFVSTTLEQPHNFFTFFLKYDPQVYIYKDGGTISGGFREDRNHFGTYFFKRLDHIELQKQKDILIVGKTDDFWTGAPVIKQYSYPDGTVWAKIVKL